MGSPRKSDGVVSSRIQPIPGQLYIRIDGGPKSLWKTTLYDSGKTEQSITENDVVTVVAVIHQMDDIPWVLLLSNLGALGWTMLQPYFWEVL